MKRLSRNVFFVLLLLLCSFHPNGQVAPEGGDPVIESGGNADAEPMVVAPHELENISWADSIMESLTPEERIAQLFMVAAYSNKSQAHVDNISNLVKEYKIGGLIFFQGGPGRQATLTNHYQSLAKVPLMISIDGEWGLAMRLDSTVRYPRQMTLGAIQDNQLIYNMGEDIAEQCKRLGIHVNLAPVVDINVNPKNPVINSRSFGEDRENVAEKAIAYMKGMQDHRIMANAKHFPGHGDTDTDSHKALPIINHSKSRMDSVELYPFKKMIQQGLASMMVAHLFIPELDSTKNTASTLSKPIVDGLLKQEMGFRGLVFTDALNMKGVSAYFEPGEVDLKALLAGNDVLLFSEDVPTAITKIKQAIEDGLITQEEIDSRCKKILVAKQWVGLNHYKPIDTKGLAADLNKTIYEGTNRSLWKAALTLVKNEGNLIPLKKTESLKIASIAIGEAGVNTFQSSLSDYAEVKHFQVGKEPSRNEVTALMNQLEGYNLLVFSVHKTSNSPGRNFGVSPQTVKMIEKLKKGRRVVLDLFANPYSLAKLGDLKSVDALIVSYEDRKLAQSYSAQLIFGGIKAKGKLPVSASPKYPRETGIETAEKIRFEFGIPEEVGISTDDLAEIETIVRNGIDKQAYPGCQVLVAKNGNVIYRKSFGHHTYEEKNEVLDSDIYDLASITKITASTAAVMKLYEDGIIDIDRNLCDYLPELVDTTAYLNMNIREMLAHQAGLVPWIPFYQKTLIRGYPKYDVYSLAESETYPHRVAENLYIHKDYPDTMIARIMDTRVNTTGNYKYSDVGYYLIQLIIERETGMTLDEYLEETYYSPLGLTTLTYRPREKFDLDRIVPTEYDLLFRKQLVHGDVHDPGAAMMGGVAGHAGLFSNALDLAIMMQMYANGGTYGGEKFLEEATIREFVRCQFCDDGNRRGAGFDKPVRDGGDGPTCNCISLESFGHTGFTGTIAWVDPEEDLVYVFLSNRVYPDAGNKKLVKMGIRTEIMEVIYDAINRPRESAAN